MSESPLVEAKLRAQQAVRRAIKRGDLVRPTHCERCNRMVEVQGHHHDYAKPLEVEWICRLCHAAEHREPEPEWAIAARVLRDRGLTYREIGELLGKDKTTVYGRVNIEQKREYSRRSNKKQRPRKREWENARKADPAYRGACIDCGGLMGIGCPYDGLCAKCQPKGMTEALKAEGRQVEKWWNEGLMLKEIAARLGRTVGSVGGFMDMWRAEGFDMPYRYSEGKRGGRKYEHQVKNVKNVSGPAG